MTNLLDRMMPDVPLAARTLGLAGLIPFAGLALMDLVGGFASAEPVLALYGAVILSFMGGCRWGFAAAGLGDGARFDLLAWSVLPCLFAWAVIWLPGPFPLLGLGAGITALYWADLRLTKAGGAPVWWPQLRLPLSVGAALSLIVAGLA